MTGQKNRFSTTEKLWDLDDKKLKSPKNDAMICWLMEEENGEKVGLTFEKEFMEEDSISKDYYSFKNIEIESEVPIYSNTNFTGGYADIIYFGIYDVEYKYPEDKSHFNRINTVKSKNKLIEVKPYIDSFGAVLRQIKTYRKFIEEAHSTNYHNPCRLNKFVIDEYCIFTLDDRFDKQFKSQGIKVLHPPKDITIDDMRDMYDLW